MVQLGILENARRATRKAECGNGAEKRGNPTVVQTDPRGVLNSNQGFVELGAFVIHSLRRAPIITFYAWNAPAANHANQNGTKKSAPDPLRLARYYQSLLDSGKFENRASLARHLGVSRARVTQVLNRLNTTNESPTSDVKTARRL